MIVELGNIASGILHFTLVNSILFSIFSQRCNQLISSICNAVFIMRLPT